MGMVLLVGSVASIGQSDAIEILGGTCVDSTLPRSVSLFSSQGR